MTAFSDETGRDFPFSDKETLAHWLNENFFVAEDAPEKWDDLPEWHRTRFRKCAQMLWHVIAALSASPVAQEPVATKKVYIKPLRTIVEIQTAYADQIRDWLNTSTPAPPAAPVVQEPVAWQWRYKGPSLAVDDDGWSVWLPIEYSIESFRETFADKIERGTVEYRPLYAGTPPATPAGVGADEIAFFQAVADGYSGKIEHGCLIVENPKADPQSLALGGVSPNLVLDANAILALLSRAGDQSNSTQKNGSR